VESAQLPQPFHRDPADQLLVATTRIFDCPLMRIPSDGDQRSEVMAIAIPN
jgi:PIN domain nuclease of toxin-antitoxin system